MLDILLNISLPIFILMGLGVVLDKAFTMDIPTLTQLSFWVFSPVIVFITIVDSELGANEFALIAGYSAAQVVIMLAIGWAVYSLRLFEVDRTTMAVGVTFYNTGNYGFPLMLLAFGEYAVGIIAIVLLVQAIMLFSVGIVLLDPQSTNLLSGLRGLVRVPVLWAILLGFVVRITGLPIPEPVMVPLDRIFDAFIAVALIALGVQLARVNFARGLQPIAPALVMRLVVSPLVSFGLLALIPLSEEIRLPLLLAAGLPTAVNLFILSQEYDRDPDLASLLVFWTTLLSGLTLPLLLVIIR